MTGDQHSLIGRTLGQYQIIAEIGAGGMARVYKAYQPGLDRYVAIKVLPAQHALTPGFKERFIREARTVAQLQHPNILPIYDVGLEGDQSYFVMQYVSGQTLRQLQGQPMALPVIGKFIDQIAAALDHAHERDVLHRDVKPDNILLEGDWLMLADFGLAKIRAGQQNLTGTGMIIGTPMYASPEQIIGGEVNRWSDIYSMGVVLYEMVTGQVPYLADTTMALMFKHVHEPLPSPRLHRPDLPVGVEHVLAKALAKAPEDRFATAGELAAALREAISSSSPSTLVTGRPAGSARLFICYKRDVNPDQQLADHLYEFLTQQGHTVFVDRTMRTGETWLNRIDQEIKDSDFLIVLLSNASAGSEMVQSEVRRAYEYRKLHGAPRTLPIRLNYQELLPYALDAFLDPLQYVVWENETDTPLVCQAILAAIAGQMPQQSPLPRLAPKTNRFSEDGGVLLDSDSLHPPLPEFDPRLLETLEAPGGVVKLRDKFYIERQADAQLRREVIKPGTTTTIRASRQTGKSSLLVRGVNYAKEHGAKVVTVDLQRIDTERLTSPELFLRDFAELIVRKLRLDVSQVEQFWRSSLGPQDKLTYLMEDYILPEAEAPVVLALDEVDRLLQVPFHSDFFGLLRSWHNSRALDEIWDRLNLVMVISTEPYMLIADVNQSPFNVGLKIYLDDFDQIQMRDLNRRHGYPVAEADFLTCCELLGGHPYLIRKALYTLVAEHLTWPELMRVATFEQGPFGDHLRRHQWLLRDEPDLRQAFKHIIDGVPFAGELAVFRLLQAGLIKGSGDSYACRCDLYRLYFKDKL